MSMIVTEYASEETIRVFLVALTAGVCAFISYAMGVKHGRILQIKEAREYWAQLPTEKRVMTAVRLMGEGNDEISACEEKG